MKSSYPLCVYPVADPGFGDACEPTERVWLLIITDRIRSMGQSNVFTSIGHSVHRRGCLLTMPWGKQTPLAETASIGRLPQKPDPPQTVYPPDDRQPIGERYASYWNTYFGKNFLKAA